MPSGAKLLGVPAMQKCFKTFQKKFPNEVEHALYIETEIESKEVKRRVPVDKGILRGTVHVEGPFRVWRSIYCLIVVGGPAASYAMIVHEDLEAFHEVGQAKYLESVIMESRSSMAARVAKRIELNRCLG